jgi:hypothetical protein
MYGSELDFYRASNSVAKCFVLDLVRISNQDRCGSVPVEEKDGLGKSGGRCCGNGMVFVGVEATDDLGSGWFIDAQASCTDGDEAIWIDTDPGALTLDIWPSRTGRSGAHSRAFSPGAGTSRRTERGDVCRLSRGLGCRKCNANVLRIIAKNTRFHAW